MTLMWLIFIWLLSIVTTLILYRIIVKMDESLIDIDDLIFYGIMATIPLGNVLLATVILIAILMESEKVQNFNAEGFVKKILFIKDEN